MRSKYERDYILSGELEACYSEFCRRENILGANKERIFGNPAINLFEAKYDGAYEVLYVEGVDHLQGEEEVPKEWQFSFRTGFTRLQGTDHNSQARCKRLLSRLVGLLNWIRFNLWSNKSPLYNLCTVLVHLLWILLLSFPLIFFVSCAIVSSTLLNPTYDSQAFTVADIFAPNSERKWWDLTGTADLMFWMAAVTLAIQALSILQLMSYYSTSLRISGAKKVRKTRCKTVLDTAFLVCLGVLCFVYSVYLSLVLLWFILGAVLNPQ